VGINLGEFRPISTHPCRTIFDPPEGDSGHFVRRFRRPSLHSRKPCVKRSGVRCHFRRYVLLGTLWLENARARRSVLPHRDRRVIAPSCDAREGIRTSVGYAPTTFEPLRHSVAACSHAAPSCEGRDSNPWTPTGADLESAAVSGLGYPRTQTVSNRRFARSCLKFLGL
jgi:hypothetical protein